MELETCRCKCHPVREVCRVCCVRTAKDESFDLMMKQNQTALDLQEKVKELELQNNELTRLLEKFFHDRGLSARSPERQDVQMVMKLIGE